MTADGHVVGVELFAVVYIVVDVFVHGDQNHFMVGVGPAAGGQQLESAVNALVVIAQIGVGLVAVIEAVGVVVVSAGGVSQLCKLVAQGIGHILIGTCNEGQVAVHGGGNQTAGRGEFTACGALVPVGLVEVGKLEALAVQLVQGGGQLGVNDIGREGLCHKENQVLILEHACVFVLLGGGQRAEVAVHILQGLVGFGLSPRSKVDVHGVICVNRVGGRCGGHDFCGFAAAEFGGEFGDAEHAVSSFQLHAAHQAEAGDGRIYGIVCGEVVTVVAEIAAAQQNGQYGGNFQHQEDRQRSCALFRGCSFCGDELLVIDCQHQHGQQRRHDVGNALDDGFNGFVGEVRGYVTGHGEHISDFKENLEEGLYAVFRAEHNHQQEGDDCGQRQTELTVFEEVGEAVKQCTEGGCENQQVQVVVVHAHSVYRTEAQQKLFIDDGQREK